MWEMLASLLRPLGLGRAFYHCCYRPSWPLRSLFQWDVRAMRARASTLAVPAPADRDPREVAFLTGNLFWYQSLFCAYSLAMHSKRYPTFRFYDDGTLRAAQKECLTRALPGAVVVGTEETEALLERELPRGRFPFLRQARDRFVLMRKFLDVFLGRPGHVTYLDSDMLFWDHPEALWELADAGRPFYMTDVSSRYCDEVERLTALFGVAPVERLNSGIIGVTSRSLDYGKAEHYCKRLFEYAAGDRHFFEQTLWGLLLAETDAVRLRPEDYRLVWNEELAGIIAGPRPVTCLHYCWKANREYRRSEWKRCLRELVVHPQGSGVRGQGSATKDTVYVSRNPSTDP